MRTGGIKAIPEAYAGIIFRSKTESRFARWCDKCNTKWLYEPDGFVTPDGQCYLPDFYLPEIKTIVEIKPPMFLHEADKMFPMINDPAFKEQAFLVATMHNYDLQPLLYWEWDDQEDWCGYGGGSRCECPAYFGNCLQACFCLKCDKPLIVSWGSWGCRHCGEYEGDHYLNPDSPFEVGYANV